VESTIGLASAPEITGRTIQRYLPGVNWILAGSSSRGGPIRVR
jgi:hypothetical protein